MKKPAARAGSSALAGTCYAPCNQEQIGARALRECSPQYGQEHPTSTRLQDSRVGSKKPALRRALRGRDLSSAQTEPGQRCPLHGTRPYRRRMAVMVNLDPHWARSATGGTSARATSPTTPALRSSISQPKGLERLAVAPEGRDVPNPFNKIYGRVLPSKSGVFLRHTNPRESPCLYPTIRKHS